MKKLYFDCGMGAAGDMLGAALLELMPDPEAVLSELNALGIPGVRYRREQVSKCGIRGTLLHVEIHGEEEENHIHEEHGHTHHHSGMHDIQQLVHTLPLSEKCRRDVLSVYQLLAEAESKVHGLPVSDIHFHEVGTMDAVADIVAVCRLMELLSPEAVYASPVHVGSGKVRCAHGILPVPAPATAEILKGVPVCGGEIRGELCTPTGAALLRHFVHSFGDMPVLTVRSIGYGMGKKDFTQANCLRALLGESEEAQGSQDTVTLLSCNLDDMSGEELGFAMERLLDGGALDVYTVPIGMKKNRPGTMLGVICRPEDRDAHVRLIFRHTTTIGVRIEIVTRCVLDRKTERQQTVLGEARVKTVSGFGVSREKWEYEDLAHMASAEELSLREVREILDRGED